MKLFLLLLVAAFTVTQIKGGNNHGTHRHNGGPDPDPPYAPLTWSRPKGGDRNRGPGDNGPEHQNAQFAGGRGGNGDNPNTGRRLPPIPTDSDPVYKNVPFKSGRGSHGDNNNARRRLPPIPTSGGGHGGGGSGDPEDPEYEDMRSGGYSDRSEDHGPRGGGAHGGAHGGRGLPPPGDQEPPYESIPFGGGPDSNHGGSGGRPSSYPGAFGGRPSSHPGASGGRPGHPGKPSLLPPPPPPKDDASTGRKGPHSGRRGLPGSTKYPGHRLGKKFK